MKRLTVLMSFILFIGMMCISQDSIYILHPAVGEIIDRYEKTDFALFPEVSNSKFEYGYIKQAGGNFWLKSHLYPDSMVTRQLDTSEIKQVERNIEMALASNPNLRRTGTDPWELRSVVTKPAESDQTNTKFLYPGTLERINNEVIIDERLRDDSEMKRLWQQGSNIDNAGMYIDFSYRKKKK
jgi:hypothetical protein